MAQQMECLLHNSLQSCPLIGGLRTDSTRHIPHSHSNKCKNQKPLAPQQKSLKVMKIHLASLVNVPGSMKEQIVEELIISSLTRQIAKTLRL